MVRGDEQDNLDQALGRPTSQQRALHNAQRIAERDRRERERAEKRAAREAEAQREKTAAASRDGAKRLTTTVAVDGVIVPIDESSPTRAFAGLFFMLAFLPKGWFGGGQRQGR